MIIRKATIDDAIWILEIRNNSQVTKFFKKTWEISLEQHRIWLEKYLNNKYNLFLICIDKNCWKIVWYIRKDCLEKNKFELSIAIDINFQKQWIASILLSNLLENTKYNEILFAEIFKNNIKSINFFKKHSFKNCSETEDIILLKYKNA